MQESVLPPTEIEPTWADFTAYSPGSNSLDLDRNPEEWENNGYLSFIYNTWPLHGYKLQYDYVQSQKPLSDESLSRLLTIDEILSLNLPNSTLNPHHMIKNIKKKVLQVGTIAPKEDENFKSILYSNYNVIFKNVDQVLLAQPTSFQILGGTPLGKLVAVNVTDITIENFAEFFGAAKQLRSLTISFPDEQMVPLAAFRQVPKTLYELTIHGKVSYTAGDAIAKIQSVRCLRLKKFSLQFDSRFWTTVKNVFYQLTVNNNNNIEYNEFHATIATSCQYLSVLDLSRTNLLNDYLLAVLIDNKVALRVLRADFPARPNYSNVTSPVGFSFFAFRSYLIAAENNKLEMLTCRGHQRLPADVYIIENIASIRRLRVLDLRETSCTVGVNVWNLHFGKFIRRAPGSDTPEVLHLFVSEHGRLENVNFRFKSTAWVRVHYASTEEIPTALLHKYKESVSKVKQKRPSGAREGSDSEHLVGSAGTFSPAYARSRVTSFARSIASTGSEVLEASVNRLRDHWNIESPTVAQQPPLLGASAIVEQYDDQPTTSQSWHPSTETKVKAVTTIPQRTQAGIVEESIVDVKQRRLALEEARLELEKERLAVEKEIAKTLQALYSCVRAGRDVLF
jgi:hypothetical protein